MAELLCFAIAKLQNYSFFFLTTSEKSKIFDCSLESGQKKLGNVKRK